MTLTPSRSRTILHVRSGALQSHQSLGAGAGPVPARPVQGGGPSPRRQPQLPPCQEAGGGHHRAQGNEVTWPRRPRVTPLSSTSGGCHTGHERRRLLKGHFRGFNTMSRCIFGLYCTLEVWLEMLLSCIMGIVGCVVFLVSDKYSEYSAPDVSILVKSLSWVPIFLLLLLFFLHFYLLYFFLFILFYFLLLFSFFLFFFLFFYCIPFFFLYFFFVFVIWPSSSASASSSAVVHSLHLAGSTVKINHTVFKK